MPPERLTGEEDHVEYEAHSIGHRAFQALADDQELCVLGTTSRGLFIRTVRNRIIFVSDETYRSPLSITLNRPINELRLITVGSPVEVATGKLVLPSIAAVISANSDALWHQPAASGTARPHPERLDSLKLIAREVLTGKPGLGLSGLLPLLLDLPAAGGAPQAPEPFFSTMLRLRRTMRDGELSHAAEITGELLGMGRGLTPSGDDFIVGLLLMLNRWQAALLPASDLEQINRRIVEAAYAKTTTLSANLIECAASGEADERLVNVADCICAGRPPEADCVPGLLDWGASSGADALVGMVVALTLYLPEISKGSASHAAI